MNDNENINENKQTNVVHGPSLMMDKWESDGSKKLNTMEYEKTEKNYSPQDSNHEDLRLTLIDLGDQFKKININSINQSEDESKGKCGSGKKKEDKDEKKNSVEKERQKENEKPKKIENKEEREEVSEPKTLANLWRKWEEEKEETRIKNAELSSKLAVYKKKNDSLVNILKEKLQQVKESLDEVQVELHIKANNEQEKMQGQFLVKCLADSDIESQGSKSSRNKDKTPSAASNRRSRQRENRKKKLKPYDINAKIESDVYNDGYINGYKDGYNDGYNNGDKDGYNDGYNNGYNNGYHDGYGNNVSYYSSKNPFANDGVGCHNNNIGHNTNYSNHIGDYGGRGPFVNSCNGEGNFGQYNNSNHVCPPKQTQLLEGYSNTLSPALSSPSGNEDESPKEEEEEDSHSSQLHNQTKERCEIKNETIGLTQMCEDNVPPGVYPPAWRAHQTWKAERDRRKEAEDKTAKPKWKREPNVKVENNDNYDKLENKNKTEYENKKENENEDENKKDEDEYQHENDNKNV